MIEEAVDNIHVFEVDNVKFRLHDNAKGPYHAEKFKTGYAVVLDTNKINWLSFGHGKTLTTHDLADKIVAHLNA